MAGLFGLGTTAKAVANKPDRHEPLLPIALLGRWSHDWASVISKKLKEVGLDSLPQPNADDTWNSFFQHAGDQLEHTGMALIWTIPNKIGNVCELYVIPTAFAVPCPVLKPDYPDGYYRICPIHYPDKSGMATLDLKVPQYLFQGVAAIPAQWMLRIKSPYCMEDFGELPQDEIDRIQNKFYQKFVGPC